MAHSTSERPALEYYEHLSPYAPEAPEVSPDATIELGKLCAACQRARPIMQEEVDIFFKLPAYGSSRRKSFTPSRLFKSGVEMYRRMTNFDIEHKWIELHRSIREFHDSLRNGCHLCALLWAAHCRYFTAEKLVKKVSNKPDTRVMVRLYFDYDHTLELEYAVFLQTCLLTGDDDEDDISAIPYRVPLQAEERSLKLETHGLHHPISTASESSVKLARNWLGSCASGHPRCKQQNTSFLPTRLVDVSTALDDHTVKLVLGEWVPKPTEYAALSYCWGTNAVVKLESTNVNRFFNGVSINQFARTIQDAIYLTRCLDVKYLWIDSLCILQDSNEDFLEEAATMCDVYQNSFVTLAGISASTSSEGLYSLRDPLMYTPVPLLEAGEHRRLWATIAHSGHFDAAKLWPLYSRGWVLQERLLSPRTLKVGSCMLWECREDSKQEFIEFRTGPQENSLSASFWSTIMQKPIDIENFRLTWGRILINYSNTEITRGSDKLIALSGVITALKRATEWENAHGLWMPFMASELLWSPKRNALSTGLTPTWSWAAWDDVTPGNLNLSSEVIAEFELLDPWVSISSIRRDESDLRPALRVNCLAISNTRYQGTRSGHPQADRTIKIPKGKIHFIDNHSSGVLVPKRRYQAASDASSEYEVSYVSTQPEFYLLFLNKEREKRTILKDIKSSYQEIRDFMENGDSPGVDALLREHDGLQGIAVIPSQDCPGAYERVGYMFVWPEMDKPNDILLSSSVLHDKRRRMDFVLV